jgi:hypothetical protein
MSRTRKLSASIALLLLPLLVPPARAVDLSNHINGIGMIDYSTGKPDFHVGSWVRYHVKAKSDMGVIDDYTVTVLIAGEEEFWGDPGFWVETWTDIPGRGTSAQATLMAYTIFADSLALQHLQVYMRKSVTGLDEQGHLSESIYERAEGSITARRETGGQRRWDLVPLGSDTVNTVKGRFEVTKVRLDQGTGATSQSRDSSEAKELRESRTMYMTSRVPITHTAREEIETAMTRKAWAIGHSKDVGDATTMDRSLGVAELLDYGNAGLSSRFLPKNRQVSLAGQRAGHRGATAAPGTKRAPARRSAAKKSS